MSRLPVLLFLLVFTLCTLFAPKFSLAYHPESPEVQRMLVKALAYLEQKAGKENDDYYNKLGGAALVGLAVLKQTGNQEHPLVLAAIERCRRYRPAPRGRTEDNYSVGLGIIFLCEIDPIFYKPEIERMLADLMYRQISDGAWTYEGDPLGDTSQTQYAALAMWIAFRSDIAVPRGPVESCCNWLIRTQAPTGGFTYKAKDPGNFRRIEQDAANIKPTMGAAGLGSLYICSEILGLLTPGEQIIAGLPPSVKEVKETAVIERSENVDGPLLRKSISDGNRWMSTNTPAAVPSQQYYYMYTLERYQAFRELADRKFEKEPNWYNNGVKVLVQKQAADGSWRADENGPIIDTAFAILFLLRSARKTIAKVVLEKGLLIGGKDLPKDLTNINLTRSGKVVSNELTGRVEDILKLLEDPNSPQGDFIADIPEEVRIESDPTKRANQMSRLKRLAMSGSFQARLTAVKSLGKVRELDNVPVLIFALSDPDPRIVHEARSSLRLISRKFEDFGPKSDNPSNADKLDAQRKWGEWYKSIRPDGELIE